VSEPTRQPGREGAIEALIDAARELFAERGPSAVSLRDVARRAGVNHGLIHHYIGSRDDLLRLVFTASMDHARAKVEGATDSMSGVGALRRLGAGNDEYTRLLAWALLEGRDPAEFHGRSSALDAIVAANDDDSRDLRVALAMAMVQTLGWKLFGPYVLAAAGFDATDAAGVRTDVDVLVDGLVSAAAAAGKRARS